MNTYDICIIGGGASGMAAAIAASMANPEVRVAIAEKKGTLGKKLAATGNGRCNITNTGLLGICENRSVFAQHRYIYPRRSGRQSLSLFRAS